MKKTLANLISEFVDSFNCGSCEAEEARCQKCLPEKQAEFLIANGAGVASSNGSYIEWISYAERRPKEHGTYLCVFEAPALAKGTLFGILAWDGHSFFGRGRAFPFVSHWAPLPQMPIPLEEPICCGYM